MNCLAHIVKYILFTFNLIFVICGILLIVIGSIMLGNIGDISSVDEINMKTIPILIIVMGCIVFVVAFFGCCGAIREDVCCTTTYAVFMFIICVLQVTLVIWIFVKRSEFLDTMDKVINETWNKNDDANGYPMDIIQLSFNCCGLDSYLDYPLHNNPVPKSCCGSKSNTCDVLNYGSKPGCRQSFNHFWASNTNIIRYAGIGVALVELVALIFACCLVNNIRKSRHRM